MDLTLAVPSTVYYLNQTTDKLQATFRIVQLTLQSFDQYLFVVSFPTRKIINYCAYLLNFLDCREEVKYTIESML